MNAAPITTQFAQVNGLRLHYASSGERGRPLIVLLHGFPEFWFAWQHQLGALGQTHFVVAPDTRGINLSEKPAELREYRAHRVAADIVALAQSLGYEEFTLVGHDWGGAIAYTIAIQHAQRVRRLVILNAVHPAIFVRELRDSPEQAAASQYIHKYRRADAVERLSRNDFAELIEGMVSTDGSVPAWFDADTRRRYIEAWSQPGALQAALNYYRAGALFPPQAGEPALPDLDASALVVRAPTLMLWGQRDRFLLPGCAQQLEHVIPDLRVERFPQASHWIAHEEPEAVSRLILAHAQS
jgi:pimeloyl-ACP methyl ester carboxylesterase